MPRAASVEGPPSWIEVVVTPDAAEPQGRLYRGLRGSWGLEARLPPPSGGEPALPRCLEVEGAPLLEIAGSVAEALLAAGLVLLVASRLGDAAGVAFAVVAAMVYLVRLFRELRRGEGDCVEPRGLPGLALRMAVERTLQLSGGCEGDCGRVYMAGGSYRVRLERLPGGGVRALYTLDAGRGRRWRGNR